MRTASFILLISFLAPLLGQLGVHSWYLANKTYVATVLCENQDLPELHCDGKCVLAQKIKALKSEQSQETELPEIEVFSFVAMFGESLKSTILNLSALISWVETNSSYGFQYLSRQLRPPRLDS